MSTLSNLPPRRSSPLLCYVTDRRSLSADSSTDALIRKIAELAAAGIDWIQIREKDLSAKDLTSLTREALQAIQWHRLQPVQASNLRSYQQNTSPAVSRTRIVVNDRLDVAIAERAVGVHLGENGLPTADARRLIASAQNRGLLAEDFLLGVSCHSLESAKAAESAGADYIFFGPVFPTPSKAAYGEPQGLARLAEVCRAVSIPILAIGGITIENAPSCIRAGASGIAAIRLFQEGSTSIEDIQKLRRLLVTDPSG